MTIDEFSKLMDGIFKLFAILAILIGGCWTLHEYEDAKKAKRIERSMVYVNSLETQKVNEAISYIASFWSKYTWEVPEGTDREKIIIDIVYKEPLYQDNLKIVLNHLDEISYCVEHEICDNSIVLKTKRGLFLAGFVNHFPWIKKHRENSGHKKYFEHLECFVHKNINKLKKTFNSCL